MGKLSKIVLQFLETMFVKKIWTQLVISSILQINICPAYCYPSSDKTLPELVKQCLLARKIWQCVKRQVVFAWVYDVKLQRSLCFPNFFLESGVVTYPLMTKKISTPRYPPGSMSLLKWLMMTAPTANALSPSISGLYFPFAVFWVCTALMPGGGG